MDFMPIGKVWGPRVPEVPSPPAQHCTPAAMASPSGATPLQFRLRESSDAAAPLVLHRLRDAMRRSGTAMPHACVWSAGVHGPVQLHGSFGCPTPAFASLSLPLAVVQLAGKGSSAEGVISAAPTCPCHWHCHRCLCANHRCRCLAPVQAWRCPDSRPTKQQAQHQQQALPSPALPHPALQQVPRQAPPSALYRARCMGGGTRRRSCTASVPLLKCGQLWTQQQGRRS